MAHVFGLNVFSPCKCINATFKVYPPAVNITPGIQTMHRVPQQPVSPASVPEPEHTPLRTRV